MRKPSIQIKNLHGVSQTAGTAEEKIFQKQKYIFGTMRKNLAHLPLSCAGLSGDHKIYCKQKVVIGKKVQTTNGEE